MAKALLLARRTRTDRSNENHRRSYAPSAESSVVVALQNGGSSLVNRRSPTDCERRLLADSTSSMRVPQRRRWSLRRPLSGEAGERVLPAMKRHSAAPSLGRSDVGSNQEAVIQFATSNVASSAGADVERTPRRWPSTVRTDYWSHGQIERQLPSWSVGEIDHWPIVRTPSTKPQATGMAG